MIIKEFHGKTPVVTGAFLAEDVSLIGEEHQAYMENPDVAPDMPDYMDDASIPT